MDFYWKVGLELGGAFLDYCGNPAPYLFILLEELIFMSISEAEGNLEVHFCQIDSLFIRHGIHYSIPRPFAHFQHFEYSIGQDDHSHHSREA